VYFDSNLKWLVDVDWYYKSFKNKSGIFCENLFIKSLHGHENQITGNLNTRIQEKSDLNYLLKKNGFFNHLNFILLLRYCYGFAKHLLFKNKVNPIYNSNENN
jgi:hypothetical protein